MKGGARARPGGSHEPQRPTRPSGDPSSSPRGSQFGSLPPGRDPGSSPAPARSAPRFPNMAAASSLTPTPAPPPPTRPRSPGTPRSRRATAAGLRRRSAAPRTAAPPAARVSCARLRLPPRRGPGTAGPGRGGLEGCPAASRALWGSCEAWGAQPGPGGHCWGLAGGFPSWRCPWNPRAVQEWPPLTARPPRRTGLRTKNRQQLQGKTAARQPCCGIEQIRGDLRTVEEWHRLQALFRAQC